jgi:conjugal transfer pilus assembly protein TrbC
MASLSPLDWLWAAPAAVSLLIGAGALLAWRRGLRRWAARGAIVAGVLAAAAAAPSLAQTAQDIVDLAARKTDAAAADAQALVNSAQGSQDAYLKDAQAIAAAAPARAKAGLAMLQGSPFDPGGAGLATLGRDEAPSQGVVYVAVSFSMPPQDLRRLAHDAEKAGAFVVIQGLVNGSFKETLLRAQQVFEQGSLGGVAIDPNVFRAFHVETVPTFIAAAAPVQPCGQGLDCAPAQPANDQVRGNVSLAEALRLLAASGEQGVAAAAAAKAKLEE